MVHCKACGAPLNPSDVDKGICRYCGEYSDYEPCGDCGFDHVYEPRKAVTWHLANDPMFLFGSLSHISFKKF